MIANPSLRWLAAYVAAALVAAAAATLGMWAVTGLAPSLVMWLRSVVPFTAFLLFVPLAVASFLLMKAGAWTRTGFIVAGAGIPLLFFGAVMAMGNAPGDNFATALVVWMVSGALAGAVFHQVWEKLS